MKLGATANFAQTGSVNNVCTYGANAKIQNKTHVVKGSLGAKLALPYNQYNFRTLTEAYELSR